MLWWPVGVIIPWEPFDYRKHDRIGAVTAVLGIIFAFAAYRQPFRRRTLTHIALALSIIALLLYLLTPQLGA
jgi:uncharacterized membrane protein